MIKIFLKKFRLFFLQNQREIILSKTITNIIIKLKKSNNIKILDYGSGFEPKVASFIKKNLDKNKIKNKITCLDLYNKKNIKNLSENYSLEFKNISYLNQKKKYDFIIVADVLHHIGVEDRVKIKKILSKLKSKSKIMIIKDHFEYNFCSRQILRFMDFFGNYYLDVNVPKKYFRQEEFDRIIEDLNFKIIFKMLNIKYYKNFFVFFTNPKLHYIYVTK